MLATTSIIFQLTYLSENCTRILEHLKSKLDVPAFEWRRILKVCYIVDKHLIVTKCNGILAEAWAYESLVGFKE